MTVESVYRIIGDDRISHVLKGIDKNTRTLDKTIARMGSTLVAAFGAAAIGSAISSAINFGDQVAKLSRRLETNARFVSSLGFIARSTGVNLQMLTTALEKQSVRVAQAARGTGAAAEALATLGINAQAFARLDIEQQFYRLADALSNVKNQGERARLSTALWEESGVRLATVFEGGSKAIKGMITQAENLNQTLSDDEAAELEATSQAIENMTSAWTGLARQIIANVAPALTFIADVLRAGINAVSSYAESIANIARALNHLRKGEFDEFKRILKDNASMWDIAKQAAIDTAAAWTTMTREFEGAPAYIEAMNKKLNEAGGIELPKVTRAAQEASEGLKDMSAAYRNVTDRSYEWITANDRGNRSLELTAGLVKDSIAQFKTLADRRAVLNAERQTNNTGYAGVQITTDRNGKPVEGSQMLGFTYRQGLWRRNAPQIGSGGFAIGGGFATGGIVPADGTYSLERGERVISNSTTIGPIHLNMRGGFSNAEDGRRFVRDVVVPELRAAQR